MSNLNPLLSHSESEIEKFIDENLSPFHVRWLTMQRQALGHTRTRIFEAILSDWFSRHRSRNHARQRNRAPSCRRIHFALSE